MNDDSVAPSSAMGAPSQQLAPDYRELLLLFISSRLLIYLTAGLGLVGINKPADFIPPKGVADWFYRWDSPWYMDVIEHGYRFTRLGESTNVGYFPLYPMLSKLASLGGLIDPKIAAYLVALIGLWLSCVLLWKLVARESGDARLASLSVAFLLFSPVSFFFSSIYSESWFLPLTIGCIAAARARKWWLAGCLGALAAFTRYVGMALIVPLLWEYLISARPELLDFGRSSAAGKPAPTEPGHRFSWRTLPACLLPLAGFGAYCGLMWVKFGNPLMYSEAQVESGRHFTMFWGLFARPSFWGIPLFYQVWFAGSVLIAFALLFVAVLLRIRTTYAVYVLTFSFIYLSARFVDSLPRYFAGLFPFYLMLALIARRWPRLATPLLAGGAMLQTISIVLFVNGYWFT